MMMHGLANFEFKKIGMSLQI